MNTQKLTHILFALLMLLCLPSSRSAAQQPSAEILQFKGKVTVVLQGVSETAKVGMMLGSGDLIETEAGAGADLRFSDGSLLQIGQKSKIDIAELTQHTDTKARTSRLNLIFGKLRAFLAPDHQHEGSKFTMQTPNALVGVKFSQPDVAISYDPESETTIFWAYTVEANVRNLETGAEVKTMPKGHKAVVKDDYINVLKIPDDEISGKDWENAMIIIEDSQSAEEELAKEVEQVRMDDLLSSRIGSMGAISASPGVDFPNTSSEPSSGRRPVSPDKRSEPVGFSLTITER